MKVLLDENLPRKLTGYLTNHVCHTVAECGWAGKKNGELLTLAELRFDVMLTLDKNVPYRQHMPGRRIDLASLVPHCLAALESIQSGEVIRIGKMR